MRIPSLDESAIARLVDRFYDQVQADPVLGPVFDPVVHDWPAHKRLLVSFWCSVALRANSYRGNPMAAHRSLPIDAGHFEHWLGLWRATCRELLDEAPAAQMIEYAERIGRSLRMGLGLSERSGMPVPGAIRTGF
ncbi:group III truncated hemoglobin [Fulvimonas soli]|jgi:hemoglobin|uniref:Hemoglobin n=1 Tax=Fulvimonas soli TaxID=155197 RepID=A0A316HXB6_9GAMM|nr:group III truncated hemoglobin [Fulvimonas soli]PWK85761.1 hemoglobin [Fulvimonas soli]TNY25708.1 preprotein translocase subunit TatC [Fulvimonas soli]